MTLEQAEELAAAWTKAYFLSHGRGRYITLEQYRQIYDMALGHYLKEVK